MASSCAVRNCPWHEDLAPHAASMVWTRRDSNPRPPACKAGALPLSYGPTEGSVPQISSKEVIEPQVPLRLPCYDLAPLAELGFDPPNESRPHPNPTRVA